MVSEKEPLAVGHTTPACRGPEDAQVVGTCRRRGGRDGPARQDARRLSRGDDRLPGEVGEAPRSGNDQRVLACRQRLVENEGELRITGLVLFRRDWPDLPR